MIEVARRQNRLLEIRTLRPSADTVVPFMP